MSRPSRNRLSIVAFLAAGLLTLFMGLRAWHETVVQAHEDQNVNDALQALLESSQYGKAIMDDQGRVILWNPALERLSGWSSEEVKRHGLGLVMGEETFLRHQKAYQEAFRRQQTGHVRSIQCEIPQPESANKPAVPVSIRVRIVQSRHGKRYAIAQVDRISRVQESNYLENQE